MGEILYAEESYAIVGACFEVYNELGCGFLEPVYHECLQLEFAQRGIAFRSKFKLPLTYKGQLLQQEYIPDFVCFERIILEIKAVKELNDEFRAQVHNYLKATGYKLGILVNFGRFPKLQSERIVR